MRTGGGGYRNNTTLAAACMEGTAAVLIRIEATPGFAGSTAAVREVPLHMAAIHSDTRPIALRLRRGADPNVRDDSGQTPLHNAVMRKRVEAIKVLLQYGADPTIPDNKGKTPLDLARERGIAEVIAKVASAGRELMQYIRTNKR